MKKLVLTLAALACASSMAYAQGTVVFVTSILGASAKVTEAEGFNGAGQPLGNTAAGVASGTQFLAQLFYASGVTANTESLVPVGNPVNFRGGTGNSGYVQESGTTSLGQPVSTTITLPDVLPAGGVATLQLRAWWAGPTGNTYMTWAQAASSVDPLVRFGWSLPFQVDTGDPTSQPPGTPSNLNGLAGFQLVPVPEPTTFALAGLGAAALLIFRRRK